jgi:hypothetical protein
MTKIQIILSFPSDGSLVAQSIIDQIQKTDGRRIIIIKRSSAAPGTPTNANRFIFFPEPTFEMSLSANDFDLIAGRFHSRL